MFTWGNQQDKALITCQKWLRDPHSPQVLYLAGFAGTGKTTLAKYLVGAPGMGRWLFAAYTGKAAHVLRQKGCDEASTIHSLIYRPAGETLAEEIQTLADRIMQLQLNAELTTIEKMHLEKLEDTKRKLMFDQQPMFSLWANSPLSDIDVVGIVIDEVSMVDRRIGQDLESFSKKILVLGDPAQLPPVGAAGYFTKQKPDIMLTEVHRHAKESSVLRLATIIREGGSLKNFQGDDSCHTIEKSDKELIKNHVLYADQVLVGRNVTRRAINKRYREILGRTLQGPEPKDRLVCLRNEHGLGLFNGSQWVVQSAKSDMDTLLVDMSISSEENAFDQLDVESWMHHMIEAPGLDSMGDSRRDFCEFDWSYALTVHKAQGSQWDKVLLFDESRCFNHDGWRWLYTGITRASKELRIVI